MKRLLHENLVSITQSSLIAGIGRGLVGIFLPLLLINRGLELWQVCLFYVGYAVIKFVINYPCIFLINRYGARLGLVVGYGATAIYMVLLTLYVGHIVDWAIWLLPVAMAMQNAFLWSSAHLHISRVMDSGRKSQDLAMMENVQRVAGIAAPFVGGLVALHFGQVWLTLLASLVVIVAVVPVWRMDKLAGGHKSEKDLGYSLKYAPGRDLLANIAFNIHTSVGVMMWPIYLAVFIPNFQDIGLITTIASGISVIVLHVVGKRGDKGKAHQVLLEGTALSSLVHIGRIVASSNPLTVMTVSAAYDVALAYQLNPWVSIYYHHARDKGVNYILSMEIANDIAYVALWGVLGLIAFFVPGTAFFTVGFVGAAVIAWGVMLITKERAPSESDEVLQTPDSLKI